VLKHHSEPALNKPESEKWVFGVGSNYLLNLKLASQGEAAPVVAANGEDHPALSVTNPTYAIEGPRSAYRGAGANGAPLYKAPVHVRRSQFRLPTNPKTPILMIGPGTGVAPFRGFVQERVALARKAVEKNSANALDTWGQMSLFYGCRSENEDFLYADEWPEYTRELNGKFTIHTAFSRSGPRKADGSKIYVQDLMWADRENIKKMVWEQKGNVYICGDAKSMSKAVEEVLARILGEAKGKSVEEGFAEIKSMKERSKLLLDVWS